jgi:Skp family chaperone for outer membrane proteins
VRVSLAKATIVAGLVSMFAWAAPLVAQGPQVPRPATAGVPTTAPAPAATGTSVVVIDVAFIFKNHFRFNARMNDIKKEIEAFETQIRTEQQSLQARSEGLKQYGSSSPEYKRLEEELARLGSDMQVKVGLKRKEFLEHEARVYFDIYREIEQTVAVFCQLHRIGLVLRFNGDEMKPDDRNSVLAGVNRAVVYQQNLDITQHILQKLNAGAQMPPQQPTVGPGTPTGGISRPPTGGIPPAGRPGPGAPR